jgi:hypothetical protein
LLSVSSYSVLANLVLHLRLEDPEVRQESI